VRWGVSASFLTVDLDTRHGCWSESRTEEVGLIWVPSNDVKALTEQDR
jgi:hypothetical protein